MINFLGNFLVILNLVLFLNINVCLVLAKSKTEKCELCTELVDEFIKGLKKTSKGNFGGGNTDWEDRKLGSYLTSETRFEEIIENMCSKTECHQLLEEQEDNLFNWFRNKQKQIEEEMFKGFCIESIKYCCPKETFGEKCSPCLKINDLICNGNGKCNGDGTRGGNGTCMCDSGYTGESCNTCTDKFYEEARNGTLVKCSKCHESCLKCLGPEQTNCLSCNNGWLFNDETKICEDVNECLKDEKSPPCSPKEYCENNPGSYNCFPCDKACLTCSSYGADNCYECNSGYKFSSTKVCEDIDECEENPKICGENKKCLNKPGSYKCAELNASDASIDTPEDVDDSAVDLDDENAEDERQIDDSSSGSLRLDPANIKTEL